MSGLVPTPASPLTQAVPGKDTYPCPRQLPFKKGIAWNGTQLRAVLSASAPGGWGISALTLTGDLGNVAQGTYFRAARTF